MSDLSVIIEKDTQEQEARASEPVKVVEIGKGDDSGVASEASTASIKLGNMTSCPIIEFQALNSGNKESTLLAANKIKMACDISIITGNIKSDTLNSDGRTHWAINYT